MWRKHRHCSGTVRVVLLALLCAVALAVAAGLNAKEEKGHPVAETLVVHEWGTFTSIAGHDGAWLDWRPLAGPSDLPGFVYEPGESENGLRHGAKCHVCGHYNCKCGADCTAQCGKCKTCITASVRMETPVLYFYADRECVVDVEVDFPEGKITEWYPQARDTDGGIHWGGVRVMPGVKAIFPKEDAPSHYYPARNTDADAVRVCGDAGNQYEKFLFYRGVGTFELPLTATQDRNTVRVTNAGAAEIADVYVFENNDGHVRFKPQSCFGVGTHAINLEDGFEGLEAMLGNLQASLQAAGLYEKEAAAMIETWKDDWFGEGLRVIYLVPREATDKILPLRIEPQPTELERVMVGRLELITPRMRADVEEAVALAGAGGEAEARKAATLLEKHGRFAEAVLLDLVRENRNDELVKCAAKLLEQRGITKGH